MKIRKLVLVHVLCVLPWLAACGGDPSDAAGSAAPLAASAVSTYGQLRPCGTRICGAAGQPVQLKGMSWYASNTGLGGERFYNAAAVSSVAGWGATVVRAAIGVQGTGGIAAGARAENLARARALIDGAIAAGVYVIVDWHARELRQAEAQSFFSELARQYPNTPNIIWETFHEPPGTVYSWPTLKAYHQAVIQTIRAAGSRNLVVVGSPRWSQDVDVATASPITSDPNVAYALHFAAGSHGQSLRDKANVALRRNLPLFVTQWSTCDASGNGNYNPTEATTWLAWMDANGLSSANWALNDRAETASALAAGASATGPWADAQLTTSGRFVKAYVSRQPPGPTYGLTVTNVSQDGGAGTVTSAGNQIQCGSACFYRYTSGTVVTLTAAVASSASRFVGWSGGCTGTASTCAVTMDQDRAVTATFALAGAAFPVTVSKSGSGTGAVKSTPAGIDCGATCTATWASGTVVTLTATAVAPSVFTGWAGPCAGTAAICVVTVTQATSVGAIFAGGPDLSLLVSVEGNGRAISDGGEINCPGTCSAVLPPGVPVTLTAWPMDVSTFAGWSGACTGTAPTCTVMAAPGGPVQVTAHFQNKTGFTLGVTKSGSIDGTVTSTPAGIDCGALCSAIFPGGSSVTLTAAGIRKNGCISTFAGWSGACFGTSPCVVSMTQDQAVTATFAAACPLMMVSVTKDGSGAGTVSGPNGLSCGSTCTASYIMDSLVTLTAAAAEGSTFTGWGGACAGTAATCTLTMAQNRAVTATFTSDVPMLPLSLTFTGTARGSVSSFPPGISCAQDCTASFRTGELVTLQAYADLDSGFTGWSGACSGTDLTCIVAMTEARAVTARFDAAVTPELLVTVVGPGSIFGMPGAIACSSGMTCGFPFVQGTSVTLTATPDDGATFRGWTGDAASAGSTVVIAMDQPRAVTATFGTAPAGGCKVTYKMTGQWGGGFGAALAIQNTGATPWTSWTVGWTWPSASQRITQIWNATATQSGQAVTVKNVGYNGSIAAGASYVDVGFNGAWSGSNPVPTAFTVNGIPCE